MLEYLNRYKKATISELESLRIKNRVDKRFFVNKSCAMDIIKSMDSRYTLLSVEGDCVIGYETNYYDTMKYNLFKENLYGSNSRYNIRVRNYSTSNTSYIDIKESTNKFRINKYIKPYDSDLNFKKMVESYTPYYFEELSERVAVHFNRFTFINRNRREKVTIDIDLGFSTESEVKSMDTMAIIEVKSSNNLLFTPFNKIIKKHGLEESFVSKYCLAVSTMYPALIPSTNKNLYRELEVSLA